VTKRDQQPPRWTESGSRPPRPGPRLRGQPPRHPMTGMMPARSRARGSITASRWQRVDWTGPMLSADGLIRVAHELVAWSSRSPRQYERRDHTGFRHGARVRHECRARPHRSETRLARRAGPSLAGARPGRLGTSRGAERPLGSQSDLAARSHRRGRSRHRLQGGPGGARRALRLADRSRDGSERSAPARTPGHRCSSRVAALR
jgi:hypothetical protein